MSADCSRLRRLHITWYGCEISSNTQHEPGLAHIAFSESPRGLRWLLSVRLGSICLIQPEFFLSLLKRGGKVHTAIIPNAQGSTLTPIIRERIRPDSLVHTESIQVYNVLDVSEFHHRRVNHSKIFVSKCGHHINGTENFLNQAKRCLHRFNGIPQDSLFWLLKECEWRFHGGGHNALLNQLKAQFLVSTRLRPL